MPDRDGGVAAKPPVVSEEAEDYLQYFETGLGYVEPTCKHEGWNQWQCERQCIEFGFLHCNLSQWLLPLSYYQIFNPFSQP
ncbi:hypothetical protein C455_03584 [Haloferax larsenii JCM 13917]|nr:hypothetical protein C455_03584 [Haloferax larsenii JCM 13917]